MTNTLKVRLFGELQFYVAENGQWKRPGELLEKGSGKKQLAFLTYLLLHHKRKISSEELIQHFWPEHSKDPANSLKNTMHKTRVLLKKILPDCDEIIITDAGGFHWNSQIQILLDTDQFDTVYEQFRHHQDRERVDFAAEAFDLYEGNILSDYPQDWLNHLNTYYLSAYIDTCRTYILSLQEENDWERIVQVCQKAYLHAPEIEELTISFMLALISLGSPTLAIHHYDHYKKVLWKEYSLIPSAAVEKIYHLATASSVNRENYEQEFLAQLLDNREPFQAFQCSYLVFKNLLQLELRNMDRNHYPSSVVFLYTGKQLANQPVSTDTRRIERMLMRCLRSGDPFTKLNNGSFLILLSGASEENAQKVIARVMDAYQKTYSRTKTEFKYSIHPLEIDKITKK